MATFGGSSGTHSTPSSHASSSLVAADVSAVGDAAEEGLRSDLWSALSGGGDCFLSLLSLAAAAGLEGAAAAEAAAATGGLDSRGLSPLVRCGSFVATYFMS
jgi:hypothetical protein